MKTESILTTVFGIGVVGLGFYGISKKCSCKLSTDFFTLEVNPNPSQQSNQPALLTDQSAKNTLPAPKLDDSSKSQKPE